MALLVSGVEWTEGLNLAEAAAARLELPAARVRSATLVKRSLDARQQRKRWLANLRVELDRGEAEVLARGLRGVRAWSERDEQRRTGELPSPPPLRHPASLRPVVVGAGPAGLFAALRLAEAGAPSVLLERGSAVEQRVGEVNAQWRGAPLDPESNTVFGEGGAGTFSDGKVYTRRRDGELGYVFHRLVQFGADPAALQEAWAHLGTDRIRAILPAFRAHLASLGVEVRFRARVERFLVEGGRCVGVALADGEELRRAPVIVATGHSARDTWQAMLDAGASAEPRGVAVGCRVEHPQALIDGALYGGERGALPPASYRMAYTPERGRKAHTFCMCPGGMVVPASNHEAHIVVNGMSFAARRSFWANSAVIVSVDTAEFPGAARKDPLGGARWQDAIETRAWQVGGGDGRAPGQRVADLLASRPSQELPRTSYPLGVTPCDLREVFPDGLLAGLRKALRQFDQKLPGFAGPDAVLIAPETRTTAPLRFLRDDGLESTTLAGLLPVGEGAGYGGGIVSAALDGLRAADAVLARAGREPA